jgi:hypothetical protein
MRSKLEDIDVSPDVSVDVGNASSEIPIAPAVGDAVLETDAAARVLLLWGRQPPDTGRIRSDAGPENLGRLRSVSSGY